MCAEDGYVITDSRNANVRVERSHIDAAIGAVAMLARQAVIDAREAAYRPADEHEIVIQVHTLPDELGRVRLTAHWLGHRLDTGETHGPRSQAFFTGLDSHLAGLNTGRWTAVRIVDESRA